MTDAPVPDAGQGASADARPGGPSFARNFPRDPVLDRLVAAFEAGDYGRVRAEAPKLAAKTDVPAVRAAAEELRARTEADPIAKLLLGLTLALLVVLSAYWLSHDAPGRGGTPPPPPPMIERITDTPPPRHS